MASVLDLMNQHARKLSILLTLVLAVWIGTILAQGVLFVLSEQATSVAPMAHPSNSGQVEQPATRIDIAALNLFGEVAAEPAPAMVDAPRTSLNLQLLGVFSATDPKRASAIVAEVGKQGLLYHVDEKMPGNATLSSVHPDHILIKRNGRLEKLAFPETDSGQTIVRQTNARTSSNRSTSANRTSSSSSRLEQIPDRLAQRRKQILSRGSSSRDPGTVLRSYINENRDVLQQNPGEVLSQLGVSPVSEGNMQGYRIGNEVASDVLTRAGLMRGDIILSVNGQAVGDLSNDQKMIDQVLAQKRVRVGVQRKQRKFYLTVPIP